LIASRRIWGWIAGLAAPVLLGAVVTTLLWSVDKISASSERVGATSARIESLEKMVGSDRAAIEKLLDKLDQDIRELRRHTGLDPKPITIVTSP
jgi:hypothetical protein